MEIFLDVIKNKYAQFDGRARRKEYWYFVLFYYLIAILLYIPMLLGIFLKSEALIWLGTAIIFVYALGLIIPTLAVFVRRMHDIDKSGWFIFLSLVPLIGAIILLVFLFTEGTQGPNKYGADPKGTNELEFLGQKDLV